MNRKKIEPTVLDKVPEGTKALFIQMYLASNNAGVLELKGYDMPELGPLADSGAIRVTKKYIFITNYLSVNYGTIKENHNPHKKALADIAATGYDYNFELQTINIPDSDLIKDFSVLDINQSADSSIIISDHRDKPAERLKTSQTEESNSQPQIVKMVQSNTFALVLAMMLLVCQSVHTSHTLLDLSGLPEITNYLFSVSSALLLDGLLIYFVAIGDTRNSMIFFMTSSMLNIYSYHIGLESYWSYQSLFCFIPAIGIPYAVHAVSTKLN